MYNKYLSASIFVFIFIMVFSFVGCPGTGPEGEMYTVTIASLENGTIMANPTSGIEGTEIVLTVTPDKDYQLKDGTLKYGTTEINEITKTFNLPANDVTVTAEFELIDNGSPVFEVTSDESIVNSVSILGLVGTSIVSSNPSVVTAEITTDTKIKITSVSDGNTTITVSNNFDNEAIISVTVSQTGQIIIGAITKFTYDGTPIIDDSISENITTATISGSTFSPTGKKILLGSIDNNKVILSLPDSMVEDNLYTATDDGYGNNLNDTSIAYILDFNIEVEIEGDTNYRLTLESNSPNVRAPFLFYSTKEIPNYNVLHAGYVNIEIGWNILIMEDGNYEKVESLEWLFANGYKWYLNKVYGDGGGNNPFIGLWENRVDEDRYMQIEFYGNNEGTFTQNTELNGEFTLVVKYFTYSINDGNISFGFEDISDFICEYELSNSELTINSFGGNAGNDITFIKIST
jgi:hypothetical protein